MSRSAMALFTSLTLFTSLLVAQQAPTFRTRTDLVELDVSVLDKDRKPVRGLTQADFTVFEDGKPQSISIFDAVDVPDPVPPPIEWMRDVTPDVTTNETKITRLWVILIDDGLVPTEPFPIKTSKDIVRTIVDKLSPNDLATIVFTADSRKAQDFTNDRTKLLATLDAFNPGFANWEGAGPTGVDPDWQFQTGALLTLRNVMDTLVAMPNARKGLIWISPGVPMGFVVLPTKAPLPGRGESMAPIMNQLKNIDIVKDVFELSRRANVPIYPIQPCGLIAPMQIDKCGATLGTLDFLQTVSSNTNGHAIAQTNEFTPGIASIFEENKSYYQIGYNPTNIKADGSVRRIDVKVNRPGVNVRTRSEYVAPKPGDSTPMNTNATLATAVASAIPIVDLPLRATVAPFAIPGSRNAAVAIALGVRQHVPESAASGRVTVTTELRTTAFTTEGDNKGTQRHTAKVVLRAGAQGDAEYEALSRIDLAPGRYRLRLAAIHQADAKTGTVMVDVIVPDFSRDVASISGVVLTATPGRPSAPRDLLRGIVPVVPTSQRAFEGTDKVSALFDLYQSGKEPYAPATIAIHIVDEHGSAIVNETRTIAADRFVGASAPAPDQQIGGVSGGSAVARSAALQVPQQRPDTFANKALRAAEVRYQLPLDRLTPGRYLLTFESTIGTTALRRDVQFEIR